MKDVREKLSLSQEDFASRMGYTRSALSRIESGDRPIPEDIESKLSRSSWRFALRVANHRTGGWITDLLAIMPDFDLHPAALKELVTKELRELMEQLGKIILLNKATPEEATRLWSEAKDVCDNVFVFMGVLEEQFQLDRNKLIQQYENEVREGRR
ncbi:helix-turn-helix transcriptional regulator [Paenibacillus pasadenensis]|nr:helix-turn-helix transcriptional regulator [Paenibacillus pasadenensis]MCM3746568.1 helix-turn-helix transcriptional regulator [Paenibacillus pasadenensis]